VGGNSYASWKPQVNPAAEDITWREQSPKGVTKWFKTQPVCSEAREWDPPHLPVFCKKSLQTIELTERAAQKERQERYIVRSTLGRELLFGASLLVSAVVKVWGGEALGDTRVATQDDCENT